MAADDDPGAPTFERRLEQWTRDSAELRALEKPLDGQLARPEEVTRHRYQRSMSKAVALPHPGLSPIQHRALAQQRTGTIARLGLLTLAMPLLVVVAVLVGPMAAKVALVALLLPVGGAALHQVRALARVDDQRRLRLHGGLADAWRDWESARTRLESLGHPSQARAALAANESRMQALVFALARADSDPQHRDSEEQQASRQWVFRTAATALALAQAEEELEASTQRELDAQDLRLAPDGDLDSLDDALQAARALNRDLHSPPELD